MHWPQDLGPFCNYYWYDNGEEKHRLQSCIENWYGKEAKIKNPPHQCDKCGHCCGIMNSPQHPGLPPHGAGDLQSLVLTVPLLLLSNTIDVHISPFLFFQIQHFLIPSLLFFQIQLLSQLLKVLEYLPSRSPKTQSWSEMGGMYHSPF